MSIPGSGTDPNAGLAGRLPPELLRSLGAVSRVARAVATAATLRDLAQRGLAEMRDVLHLDVVALYLPDAGGRSLVTRYATAAGGETRTNSVDKIAFDAEAWRLAVSSGVPLIFHEEGSWLVENPFQPPASSWLVLPLRADTGVIGIIVAAARERVSLEPTAATVLTIIGDLLTAGIAAAQLRMELARTELERERSRLAALVHDDLAQDLALATRELALLDTEPETAIAVASRQRLRDAVTSANALVRRRLKELAAPLPAGGLWDTILEICDDFRARGVNIHVRRDGFDVHVPPATHAAVVRVITEALTNVEKHANAETVDLRVSVEDARLTLIIADDGIGFAVGDARGTSAGHLGIALMRERATEARGSLDLYSQPVSGTTIRLQVPV
ncbi:MAG: GAF domain-containing sensor histidine kinase [Solirubrobacteraceae bacterium]